MSRWQGNCQGSEVSMQSEVRSYKVPNAVASDTRSHHMNWGSAAEQGYKIRRLQKGGLRVASAGCRDRPPLLQLQRQPPLLPAGLQAPAAPAAAAPQVPLRWAKKTML